MDTFADKCLAADDIMAFMPPSFGTFENPAYQADADGDGVPDFERFQQITMLSQKLLKMIHLVNQRNKGLLPLMVKSSLLMQVVMLLRLRME